MVFILAALLFSSLALSQASIPISGYSIPAYPAPTTTPFAPQNLTIFAQPSTDQDYTIDGPYLQVVHEVYTTFPTGVAVDLDNRIFLNFPRSASNVAVTVGLATSFNESIAYPNASIQTCATGQDVATCFINVQSVVIDSIQRLWILDTGIPPGQKTALKRGAKIMAFNLTTNEVVASYVLPQAITAGGTNINDVRFNLSLSTAGVAFLTDEQGSLITIDLGKNIYKRRLFGTAIVAPDPKFVGSYDGTPFYTWNGTTRNSLTIGSDGIALANGNVYFAPLAARRVYQIPQSVLANSSATEKEVKNAVQFISQVGSYMEGFTADDQGRVYMGTAEQNSITYFNTSISDVQSDTTVNGLTGTSTNGTNMGVIPAADIWPVPFVRSAKIQWPDSMCIQNRSDSSTITSTTTANTGVVTCGLPPISSRLLRAISGRVWIGESCRSRSIEPLLVMLDPLFRAYFDRRARRDDAGQGSSHCRIKPP